MILTANPHAAYLAHKTEIDSAIQRVLNSGWYILGPEVEAFEAEFAAYIGVKHCIAVNNGTDALRLAVRALKPFSGGEGVTVSMSATATVSAIVEAGWQPLMIDINDDDYTMSIEALRAALTMPEMFIVPVHLYGQPARLDEILKLAQEHQALVLEDCAQAHGAMFNGKKVGAWGNMAAFSFYPTKNLGALGDGGAVVTDDDELARRTRLARMYGWEQRYVSAVHGGNTRLDEVQAAILRVKLGYLDQANARRIQIAKIYDEAFVDLPITLPPQGGVYHQYVIRSTRRDELKTRLQEKGIATALLYPTPIHLQPAYADTPPSHLPITEKFSSELLCLPMYPELHDSEVNEVCEAVRRSV